MFNETNPPISEEQLDITPPPEEEPPNPEQEKSLDLRQISPIENEEKFTNSIVNRYYREDIKKYNIPRHELEQSGRYAHYRALISLAYDRLPLDKPQEEPQQEPVPLEHKAKVVNAALENDPRLIDYLKDNFQAKDTISYLYTAIRRAIRGDIGLFYQGKQHEYGKTTVREQRFSELASAEDDEPTDLIDKLIDTTVSHEETVLEEQEYLDTLSKARGIILSNPRKVEGASLTQGQADWSLFQAWLQGKTQQEILEETPWLNAENSVRQALMRIITDLRQTFGTEAGKPIPVKGTKTGKLSQDRGGLKISPKERFRNWWESLSEDKKNEVRERVRKQTAERRKRAKESATGAGNSMGENEPINQKAA